MRNGKHFIYALICVSLLLSQSTTVLAEDEVTLAGVMPMTGFFGFAGVEGVCAMRDALALAEAEGGINGKKIKFVIEDGQYNLDVAMTAFNKIMATEKPLFFFAESTAMAKALAPKFKSDYKIMLGSTSFSSELADAAKNPYAFVPGPTYGDMIGILVKFIAKEKPNAKVAFFYSDTEFGKDPLKYGKLMCRKLRLDVVTEEMVPLGAKDLAPQIADLKAKDPDYVIFQGFLVDPVPQVIKACRDLGMTCKFMGTFWGATKIILDKLGPLAQGYMAVNPYMYWWNDDVPMIKKIRNYTETHYQGVKYRDNFYMQGFLNTLIAVECLRRADRAGRLNGEGLVQEFRDIKDFDTQGLSAPLTTRNNRFPVARVWASNPEKGIYEPASDWIRLDRY